MRFLQRQPTLQHTRITYFSGAFVFDGELALLFAVIDVAQLVVKQVRGRRRREPSDKHREQGRQAAHPAAEPEHLKAWRRGAESRASSSTELPVCGGAVGADAAAAAASARVLSAPLICFCPWRHAHHHHHHHAQAAPPAPQTHTQSAEQPSPQCTMWQ